MSSFLELCQGVARESGTIPGTQPSSVTGQSGRLLKVVHWTAQAWLMIQNHNASWRWMRKEFAKETSIGLGRYTAQAWNIADFAEWSIEKNAVTLYKQSTGVSDEGQIGYLGYADWKRLYERGGQTNDRPTHWTISPGNEFCLGPKPDAIYMVNGPYRKTPQILAANDDVPECPSRFHDIIKWRGVLLLAEHDEAPPLVIAAAQRNYLSFLSGLERDQLPQIAVGAEPLA
jgi:hypothetical protein